MKDLIRERVRKYVRDALKENSVVELHRTMEGDMIPFGCDACVDDIRKRIDDASYERDHCPGRSDSREHYNGILKVLRRKFRRANKINSEVINENP